MAQQNTSPRFEAKEWNAAGSTQFYGKARKRSYIVEVSLSEAIRGDLLQQAVDKTLQRLPYYRSTFVRKKGLYYYADNDLPFLVAESKEPRVIGGEITNYHMLDVTYWENRISFAMFHGLCDGLGLNRFIEAVLYHYVCLKDGKEYSDEGIYTEKIPYDPEELADIHAEKRKADTKKLRTMLGSEKRFRLPELQGQTVEKMYALPLRVKTEDFLGWCKKNGASPATAAAAIMTQSIARENEIRKGVIMCVLPASLRKTFHVEKTFKNCTAALFLPTKPEKARILTAGALAGRLRIALKEQMNGELLPLVCAGMNTLIHLGAKMPTYGLKTKLLAMGENKPQDTFYVDYVGSLRCNDYADQITDVRYLNAPPPNGATFVLMSETAGYFHINFTQTVASDRYYLGFAAILDELGIPYEKMPYESYLNPVVELPSENRR
ncbi:MAG: hypothetical protein IJJ99_01550 [Oscillospiraceae bacterium]|nr:hypothetical protein [Oscillospiraceae bacterium]